MPLSKIVYWAKSSKRLLGMCEKARVLAVPKNTLASFINFLCNSNKQQLHYRSKASRQQLHLSEKLSLEIVVCCAFFVNKRNA